MACALKFACGDVPSEYHSSMSGYPSSESQAHQLKLKAPSILVFRRQSVNTLTCKLDAKAKMAPTGVDNGGLDTSQ
jgi:hypothetical protein